jgi:hypothetical protein
MNSRKSVNEMKTLRLKLSGRLLLIIVLLQTASAAAAIPQANNAGSPEPGATPVVARQDPSIWPGSRFTEGRRKRAIMSGLNFIYRASLVWENFENYGPDFLWCFYTLSEAVQDADFRREARRMGVERAREWRREHPGVPATAGAQLISDLVFGNDAAEGLGVRDERFREQLKVAVTRFHARDYLLFDPVHEPPPADVPRECQYCRANDNSRGSTFCHVCRKRLAMRTRYDVWCDALINTYTGDHSGIELGARYVDVLKWLPSMRPYGTNRRREPVKFFDTAYTVTHVIYTLNNYSQYHLSPRLLPEEFAFLKANFSNAIVTKDTDMLGEFMDSLRAFGLTTDDPLIRRGMEYYLSHQNVDGSWGRRREKDIYLRYHPTWNAIAGLSEYSWRSEGLSFPEVKPLLEAWAKPAR